MRYRLRTLLILLAGAAVLAFLYWMFEPVESIDWRLKREQARRRRFIEADRKKRRAAKLAAEPNP